MGKKQDKAFVCTDCGADFSRWLGQCTVCGEWNTVQELRLGRSEGGRGHGYSGQRAAVQLLSEVDRSRAERISTGIAEFDRVLGQGIVCGSVVLIGGAPGAGKSTLLLQSLANGAQGGYRCSTSPVRNPLSR